MILSFEILYNDLFDNICVDTCNKTLFDVINIIKKKLHIDLQCEYFTYENKTNINNDFDNWDTNKKYYIFFNTCNYINITINMNGKIINLPQLSPDTYIYQIKKLINKNIELYYNNQLLNMNHTLDYYNIKNDNTLIAYPKQLNSISV
jgi:hypothetical protein